MMQFSQLKEGQRFTFSGSETVHVKTGAQECRCVGSAKFVPLPKGINVAHVNPVGKKK